MKTLNEIWAVHRVRQTVHRARQMEGDLLVIGELGVQLSVNAARAL